MENGTRGAGGFRDGIPIPANRRNSMDDKCAKQKRAGRNGSAATSASAAGACGSLNRQKLRENRRRIREKKRAPGGQNPAASSDALTSENDSDTFEKEGADNQHDVITHHHTRPHHAPPTAIMHIKSSKSQSDLEADCEDNTQDYDSASIVSANELVKEHKHGGLFMPAPPSDVDSEFRAHVEEIRVAGMKQLNVQPDTDTQSNVTADDETIDRRDLLRKIGEQDKRIMQLEQTVQAMNKQLKMLTLENELLKKRDRNK